MLTDEYFLHCLLLRKCFIHIYYLFVFHFFHFPNRNLSIKCFSILCANPASTLNTKAKPNTGAAINCQNRRSVSKPTTSSIKPNRSNHVVYFSRLCSRRPHQKPLANSFFCLGLGSCFFVISIYNYIVLYIIYITI